MSLKKHTSWTTKVRPCQTQLFTSVKLFGKRDNHFDPYDRAAYLLRRLITAHYFEDANKRTAWTTILDYLDRHGLQPAKTDNEKVEPVLNAIRAFDVDELAEWLESGEIDESKYHP